MISHDCVYIVEKWLSAVAKSGRARGLCGLKLESEVSLVLRERSIQTITIGLVEQNIQPRRLYIVQRSTKRADSY